jgi:hypothetical protein
MVNRKIEMIRRIKLLNPAFRSNKNDTYDSLLKKYRDNLPRRSFINDISHRDTNKFSISKRLRKIKINGEYPEILTIRNKIKKPLNAQDIKTLAYKHQNQFVLKNKREPLMIIRGINRLGFTTIKSGKQAIKYMYNDEADYYNDKVQFETKYQDFYQVEIMMY